MYNTTITMKSGAVLNIKMKYCKTTVDSSTGKMTKIQWEEVDGSSKILYIDVDEIASITYTEYLNEKVYS